MDRVSMTEPKFYDIRFTTKQMTKYNQAVHYLLELSETPHFYNGIRDALPEYKGSDAALKKEILDPIIDSLGKIKISKKRSEPSTTKKTTKFNKTVPASRFINEMVHHLDQDDVSEYYVDPKEKTTNSSKVRKIIKRYLEVHDCQDGDTWRLTDSIMKEIPDLIEDMRQKGKIEADGTIHKSNLNSCLIRISIKLCNV